MTRNFKIARAVAAILGTHAGVLAAADQSAGAEAGAAAGIQEVVVTAQRRSENVQNVPIAIHDFPALIRFAKKENIGLTVVGPEDPLAQGIVDAFVKEGLRVFGPSKDAAQLEGSKVFAKQLMRHADVPTADFRIFDHPDPARQYIQSREYVVLPTGGTIHGPFTKDQIAIEDGKKMTANK